MSATRRNGTTTRESRRDKSPRGVLFLGYFLWDEQQEVTRLQAEPIVKKSIEFKDLEYWDENRQVK